MSVHARPAPAGEPAALRTVFSVLDVTRRLFLLLGIFAFAVALTAIARDGVSLRTVNLQYSHPVTAPGQPAADAAVPR